MTLQEPGRYITRGNFQRPYVTKAADRRHRAGHRLMDLLTVVVPESDPEYLVPPEAGEFCVVDVVTREKAFFELPAGITPEQVTGMASSHFDSTAFRVGPALWFV